MTEEKHGQLQGNIPDNILLKYRLTGTGVWLLLLIIVVPFWYNNPVNFKPDGVVDVEDSSQPVVKKAYLISDDVKAYSTPRPVASVKSDNIKPDVAKKSQGKLTVKPIERRIEKVAVKLLTSESNSNALAAKPSWIIRLIAYKEKVDAEDMYQRLKYDYEAYIKFFPKSKYYSVRVGPYFSKDKALKDQKRLNSGLHIQSELVKITQPAKQ